GVAEGEVAGEVRPIGVFEPRLLREHVGARGADDLALNLDRVVSLHDLAHLVAHVLRRRREKDFEEIVRVRAIFRHHCRCPSRSSCCLAWTWACTWRICWPSFSKTVLRASPICAASNCSLASAVMRTLSAASCRSLACFSWRAARPSAPESARRSPKPLRSA